MSGAFQELPEIVSKRMNTQHIGFGGSVGKTTEKNDWLRYAKSEDLIEYGFESEFVGRLPVRAVFEKLTEQDLFEILKNPSNPIVLGKKLDFGAYGIDIKFEDALLKQLANTAFKENTGARGLVSAVENALLHFEKRLPSLNIRRFPATETLVSDPERSLSLIDEDPGGDQWTTTFDQLLQSERDYIASYLNDNWDQWMDQYHLSLTPVRAEVIADYYSRRIIDIGTAIGVIKKFHEKVKAIELKFFKTHEINIILEEETVDYLMGELAGGSTTIEGIFSKLTDDFKHGLKLILEKTGKNRFFISRDALLSPETYLNTLIRDELRQIT